MITINNHKICEDSRCYIIAEISANHNKDINKAKELIRISKECGADAVKIQTYTQDTMTINCKNNFFKINQDTLWDGKYLYDLYKEAALPYEWYDELFEYANFINIDFFSTPFDNETADLLNNFNVPAYKIASYEMIDTNFVKYVSKKGKPLIISTGIADLEEINEIVNICREQKNNEFVLLKCTSSYPAPYEDINLRTMIDMKERFDCLVGISDHTLGDEIAIAAVALGAKVVEKHITLSRMDDGPDSKFSMEPCEFKSMVQSIRNVEKAMGKVSYDLDIKKKKNRTFARSLFVINDIKKDEEFTEENIRSIRPGNGLHPREYNRVIGRKAGCDIKRGTPLSWDIIK